MTLFSIGWRAFLLLIVLDVLAIALGGVGSVELALLLALAVVLGAAWHWLANRGKAQRTVEASGS